MGEIIVGISVGLILPIATMFIARTLSKDKIIEGEWCSLNLQCGKCGHKGTIVKVNSTD